MNLNRVGRNGAAAGLSLRLYALAILATAAFPVYAQVSIPDEYEKHIQQRGSVVALDGGLAGDHVSLSSGSLEITQTDVDIPGNDGLSVRVGRRFRPNEIYLSGHFNGWDLDIPNAHGVFGNTGSGSGWINTYSVANRNKRCSLFSGPPGIAYQSGSWEADEFWQGTFFYLPGSGDQEMLFASGHVPSVGGPYPIVTREGAAIRCVTALASTSESGSVGEGFEVVTPDGVIYKLNQMVSRLESTLNKNAPDPMGLAADPESEISASKESTSVTMLAPVNYPLPRKEY